MVNVKITLGNAAAAAELDQAGAPRTVSWLLKHLPFGNRAIHSMENGREVYSLLGTTDSPPEENQSIYQSVGELFIYHKPSIFIEPRWPRHVRTQLVIGFIYERDSAIRGMSGPLAANMVGTITDGLTELSHEAPRMRREGFGDLSIQLL